MADISNGSWDGSASKKSAAKRLVSLYGQIKEPAPPSIKAMAQ